jgi:valyl-tRNA synthetase
VNLLVRTPDSATQEILERHRAYIESLTGTAALTIGPDVAKPGRCASALAGALELFLPLEGLIDVDKERGRLGKHLAELEQQLKRSTAKLASSQFVNRAPAEIVQKERDRHQDLTRQTEKLRRRLEELA